MAKLNGVFVNENGTEIMYNGELFVKSLDGVAVGDIVRAESDDVPDATQGAFYEVITDTDGDNVINDDDEDLMDWNFDDTDYWAVFKRRTTPQADSENNEDIIEANGVKYRKVTDRDAKEGDVIYAIKDDINDGYKQGNTFVLSGDYEDGGLEFTDNDDDVRSYSLNARNFVIIEPIVQEPKYREVKRKAKVGERIRIVDRALGESRYENGAEFIVSHSYPSGYTRVNNGNIAVYSNEYVVLEPITTEETTRLKVGDYVKVVNFNNFSGEIRKLIKDDGSDCRPYLTERLDGKHWLWLNADEIIRATDEEVAKAKADAELAAKWTKIGRKVDEYKVGDIIEITRYQSGDDAGSIVEIVEIVEFKRITSVRYRSRKSSDGKFRADIDAIKLITPVESRFDAK